MSSFQTLRISLYIGSFDVLSLYIQWLSYNAGVVMIQEFPYLSHPLRTFKL
jgi:hypothetical protein